MRFELHGVRGSTPAPGAEFAGYGGHTSCASLTLSDGSLLIFDAGTGLRMLGSQLATRGDPVRAHLLLSHLHWDHIIGLPFFKPLYDPRTHLQVYPLRTPEQDLFRHDPVILRPPHHPLGLSQLPSRWEPVDAGHVFQIGPARVRRVELTHPGTAQGFRVDEGGRSLLYLTDNELLPGWDTTDAGRELIQTAKGADLLVHDAQYIAGDMPHKRGWGHSEVDAVLQLGRLAGVRELVPFHHDPERDDAALAGLERSAVEWARHHAAGMQVTFAREGMSFDL